MRTRNFADLSDGDDNRITSEQLRNHRGDDAKADPIEVELRHARGHLVWVSLSASLVPDGDGAPKFFIGQVQDISERKRQEQALRNQADRDSLTGLWNRRVFDHELARSRSMAERGGDTGSVIMLDLDGLKTINDTYGHLTGDDALHRVGEAVAAGVRDSDVACRYGGDEFAVILPHTSREVATQLSVRLLADIARQRLVIGAHVLAISACAGVAEIVAGADPVADADRALYEAKRSRRTA